MTTCECFSWSFNYIHVRDFRFPEAKKEVTTKGQVKHLGDPSYSGSSQGIGTHYGEENLHDLDMFVKLAKGYVIEGENRAGVCMINAEVRMSIPCLVWESL